MSEAPVRTDDKPQGVIAFLPLAPASLAREVQAELEQLGLSVQSHGTPGVDATAHLAVALVAGEHDAADALSALDRLAPLPVFGVLAAPQRASGLAERCVDFVCWPVRSEELGMRLRRLCDHRGDARRPRRDISAWLVRSDLIGRSGSFLACCDCLARFARCDAPVLIEGETGTGKDLAARAIHYQSERADGPFVPVNCGALPEALVENELFGHAAGAFTGAAHAQRGLVAQAEGGTMFLDEVEALTARGQATLLRLLEQHEYRPLGSGRLRRSSTRIVAASNARLALLVERGEFRSDLYYRLNILSVTMPPLRERPGDLLLLIEHYMSRYRARYAGAKRVHPVTLAWMLRYPWPGNVRELENTLHRAYLLCDDEVLTAPPPLSRPPPSRASAEGYFHLGLAEAKTRLVSEFEREYLNRLMAQTGGNVTRAAEFAGKERRALGKLIKKHGIERARFR